MRSAPQHDTPFIVSGSLFVAAFVLKGYMAMFELPINEIELLNFVSWILDVGGVIVFVSAIITHRHHK